MSIQALNWAINQPIKNSGAKFVLTILANYSDEKGVSYPGQDTIADLCAMTDRAVRNHLTWLEEYGYISKSHRRHNNKNSTDLYQLEFIKEKKESQPLTRKREKLPENISASNSSNSEKHQENISGRDLEQPEKTSASFQPENISKPPGKHFQKHQENISANTKESKEETLNTHKSAGAREARKPVCAGSPPDIGTPPEKYGIFRDEVEDWWCETLGIITLPPDVNTAVQIRWLFDNKFSLLEIQQFYEYATTDTTEKSWRKGNVTLGTIVKGIAEWRRKQNPQNSAGLDYSKCPDCKGEGMIHIDSKTAKPCLHEKLAGKTKAVK